MAYRELRVPQPFPSITIDGDDYTLEDFGMDDGNDPSEFAAFRFMFEMGVGYQTNLYVIQAGGQRGNRRAFEHHFWLNGIITVDIEPVALGTPRTVRTPPLVLPVIYASVAFGDPVNPRRSRVLGQRFEARSVDEIAMEFDLEGSVRLRWSRSGGWEIDDCGIRSTLDDSATISFGDPSPDARE